MLIAIDKGVPVPEVTKGRTRIYPLDELKVGESFFVKGKSTSDLGGSVGYMRKKFPSRRYVTRTVDGGCRVWRSK